MKTFTRTLLIATAGLLWALSANAQAPANNPGVMLQGFYYDSYTDKGYGRTKWIDLVSQAQEIAETFDMIWLPPSARSEGGTGYHPKQWSNQNGDWGSKAQLTALIKKLKEINPNMKVIADIVINHKSGNNWIDFDNEDFGTYGKFTLYESGHTSKYVCQDDEVSKQSGWKATGARDSGYETQCEASGGYCAARDLDHSNSYLRDAIKAYLKWMKGEIGYDGWRYDYCKGFLGKYIKEYNDAAGNYFSVGEYWDGQYTVLKDWIGKTGNSTNAFDFACKYDAFNKALASGNYSGLVGGYNTGVGLMSGDDMKQYAVTFIDNHDTFRDTNKYGGDWTLANAYMIAMPGTPCVFWPHWVKCKNDIKAMAKARKACGITNTSKASCRTEGNAFRGEITGTKGKLVCYIGSQGTCPSGFKKACGGSNWAYYINASMSNVNVAMSPSNGYVGPNGKVTLTATPNTAAIYYTTDGSTPTSKSTKYTAPITITKDKTVIKTIAINGSEQSDVVSGTFLTEKPKGINVQFSAPSSWTTVKAYAWEGSGDAHIDLLGDWPGTAISKGADGYYTAIVNSASGIFNIIFNDGKKENAEQTGDIPGISTDCCYDGSKLDYKGKKPMPPVCGEQPKEITITFLPNTQFMGTDIYAYVWGGYISDEWPGNKMTAKGDGYYQIKFNGTGTYNVIFNGGGKETQSADVISRAGDICMDGSTANAPLFVPNDCVGPTPIPVTGQYFVRLDGKQDYAAAPTGELDFQGRVQYMSEMFIKKGQRVSEFDKNGDGGKGAEWTIPTLDKYDEYTKFDMVTDPTTGKSVMTCNTDGCYDVYIKLKFEDDMIYIGKGTNCPTDVDEADATDGITLVPNPTSGNMSIFSDKEFILGNVYTIGGKDCGSFEIYGNTLDVSRLASSNEPYQLLLIDANGNKSAAQFYKK